MAPVDVTGPSTSEPPKVVHEGAGTQGAGGGGDGGGALGQKNDANDRSSETRESDIVDGKPRDTFHAMSSAVRGKNPSAHHDHDYLPDLGNIIGNDTPAAGGQNGMGVPVTSGGPGGNGGGDARSTAAPSPGSTAKESEERIPSKENEAWQEWEKEEMEALLGEVRGHLGELLSLSIGLGS